MQTNLTPALQNLTLGHEIDEILRKCVHCGFCTATCPTYQILGDELDSPRGRIYLIKEMAEGRGATRETQIHLDRCLTCRNCETTCPSGVQYGHLIDLGREMIDVQVKRPLGERIMRTALKKGLTSPIFPVAYRLGQSVREFLPESIKRKVVARRDAGVLPEVAHHARQVILLAGCAQPGMLPSIDAATVRVLNRLDIGAKTIPGSGCCGALSFHLDDQEAGLKNMRANIDAWLPLIDSGQVEAIVMNASGCGATVREYGHHLRHDVNYAEKARRISDKVLDIAEIVAPMAVELKAQLDPKNFPQKSAFHPPCTLQHWQGLKPQSEKLFTDLGMLLTPFNETHLCCGSAGAYSVLQPEISTQLRDRKLGHIAKAKPDMILSSNIGCIGHLQSGTDTPVRHWVEVVDAALL
jgi:glycolate oxidase iron-sulfur subunit